MTRTRNVRGYSYFTLYRNNESPLMSPWLLFIDTAINELHSGVLAFCSAIWDERPWPIKNLVITALCPARKHLLNQWLKRVQFQIRLTINPQRLVYFGLQSTWTHYTRKVDRNAKKISLIHLLPSELGVHSRLRTQSLNPLGQRLKTFKRPIRVMILSLNPGHSGLQSNHSNLFNNWVQQLSLGYLLLSYNVLRPSSLTVISIALTNK